MNKIEYHITIPETPIFENKSIIDSIDLNTGISSCNEYILNSLNSYFGSINNIVPTNEMNKILPVLSGQSKLSSSKANAAPAALPSEEGAAAAVSANVTDGERQHAERAG